MDIALNIILTLLSVIFYVLVFLVLVVVLICLSHPKIIIKYKDKPEIIAALWFIKVNITKLTSRKKKEKSPKVLHFDGQSFGELPEKDLKAKGKDKKKDKKKELASKHGKKSAEKEKKPITETVSEILELVTDILDGIKEPIKRVLTVDIKKLKIIAASEDPQSTALLFGNLNTAAASLIYVCKKFAGLEIDEENVGVYSDFCASKPYADAHIVLKLSVRHIISCAFGALLSFINNKKR